MDLELTPDERRLVEEQRAKRAVAEPLSKQEISAQLLREDLLAAMRAVATALHRLQPDAKLWVDLMALR